ncbi:MAG: hypothetical protein PHS41_08530, partial [Victivallaceae bacterium]|nr:hypothetical protein [Victivallaceae bacterium]
MAESEKVQFRRIGGSYQYSAETPEELAGILTLDPALWAAVAVPSDAINADRNFLRYLDFDQNGFICVDDVCFAIRTCMDSFRSLDALGGGSAALPVDALRVDTDGGKTLVEFIETLRDSLVDGDGITLPRVAEKLAAVSISPFRGDGILSRAAVSGDAATALYAAVSGYTGGTAVPNSPSGEKGITALQLEKFLLDGDAFLAWARETQCPEFRGGDPVAPYEVFRKVSAKIDEFFSFCDLVLLDSANLERFRLDPAKLPELNLTNPKAVAEVLQAAPAAMPNAQETLDLNGSLNPAYRDALGQFKETFQVTKLSRNDWTQLKDDFSAYIEYLDKARGDSIGALGREKLETLLGGDAAEQLRSLFERDGKQGTVLGRLRTLEMLLLFRRDLWNFVNNFVSFRALFSADESSLLQAGTLILDGHSYFLTLRIPDVPAHKKIAQSSNLCMLYAEFSPGKAAAGTSFRVAVAVTGGDLARIYPGKPAYFIDTNGKHFCGKIIDVVEGPISFWQTMFAPFRRLGAAIGSRVQKLTDFSGLEKQMENTINTGKTPVVPPPAPANAGRGFFNSGSMFLLAGGLSLAAIGAAASFVVKSVVGMIDTLSKMSGWTLLSWTGGLLLCVFVPASINTVLKMRKRNLTLFLEAAGWAVNLPMRLNAAVSGLFTRPGCYPEESRFIRAAWVLKGKAN